MPRHGWARENREQNRQQRWTRPEEPRSTWTSPAPRMMRAQQNRSWASRPPSQPQVPLPQQSTPDETAAETPPDEHPIPSVFTLPEGTTAAEYVEPITGTRHETGPSIVSFYDRGYGSDDEIRTHVGAVKMQMVSCVPFNGVRDERSVRVDVTQTDYQATRVIDGLLLRAAEFVWRECPHRYEKSPYFFGTDYRYDVGVISIYMSDGLLAISASLGMTGRGGDTIFGSSSRYWWAVQDVYANQKQQLAAQQAEQAAAAERARQQQLFAQQRAAQARSDAETAHIVWVIIRILAIAGVLFWQRERIARWYYFTFHPHPAEGTVRSAISSGCLLDGNQLSAVLGEVPSGDRIFREVRIAQMDALITQMQTATRSHIREMERQAQGKYAQAAVQEAQAALGAAAVALEQAKAMLHASTRSGNV
jgi:hypothetical protein